MTDTPIVPSDGKISKMHILAHDVSGTPVLHGRPSAMPAASGTFRRARRRPGGSFQDSRSSAPLPRRERYKGTLR